MKSKITKKINRTLALLMAFALYFSSVNTQAFAQVINDTEQAVVNTTEETTIEETAESEVLTESITEQELSTQTQETIEDEKTTDVEGVSTEVEETISEEETVIESQTETEETTTVEEVITETEETTSTKEDTATKENTLYHKFEGENYQVEYEIVAQWDGHYNAEVVISNTGEYVIENWYVSFFSEDKIESIYDAEVFEYTNEKYILKNVQYNQDINVGDSVSFGFTASYENELVIPKTFEILTSQVLLDDDSIKIIYEVSDDWNDGFIGKIYIYNNTEKAIEDWELEFDFENDVDNFWTANICSKENIHYLIKNQGYNANIEAGQEICIGFNCDNGDANKLPYNFKLLSKTISQDKSNESETENLIDIGETYFKDIESEEDIVYNSENGLVYAKNQLLISALEGADKTIFEDIVADIDANIVGYIELTNDYQIEFNSDMSWDELEIKKRYLESFSFVSKVSPNMIIFLQENITTTNDKIYNMPAQECEYYTAAYESDSFWNEELPYGYNWGLEALKVPSAWDTLEFYDKINPVKVGVIDTGFDTNHKDLSFVNVFGNNNDNDKDHGTHVAGIMAAKHNNNLGISGVLTNCQLYAYANAKTSIKSIGSSMEYKIALAYLVGNNVKVINISQGFNSEFTFAMSRGNTEAQYNAYIMSSDMSDYLRKLLNKGYDFLIVVSAGNENNDWFVKDSTEIWGYRKCEEYEKGIDFGNVLAKYSSLFTNIDDPLLMKRIIVVGAMKNGQSRYGETATPFYNYTDFSNIGKRVDICAPGKEIASTIFSDKLDDEYKLITDGYALSDGTSMATPYISGLAGLIYQVNPELNAFQVKDIICNKSNGRNCSSYYLPYANMCLSEAVSKKGSNSNTSLPNGSLAGKVLNQYGDTLSNVKITAYRISVGESNLDDYYMVTDTNVFGDYNFILTQGTYNLNISCEGYLPCVVNNVEIVPNETKYLENIIMLSMPWNNMTSKVEGQIINAINGEYITNANIRVLKGWYNKEEISQEFAVDKTGSIISTTTDNAGKFKLNLPIGTYTLQIKKEGYVTGYYNVISSSSDSNGVQTLVLTPVLSDDEYRIVLTWGRSPSDLDSHLVYYKDATELMHVYYANKRGIVDGKEIAKLDYDDISSYGPETVTITLNAELLDGGLFSYYVYDFSNGGNSNSSHLSESNAVVRVYKGNELLQTYSVPQNKCGTNWDVFGISKNGLITYNEIK